MSGEIANVIVENVSHMPDIFHSKINWQFQICCIFLLLHIELRVPLPHTGCIFWWSTLMSGKHRSQSQNKLTGANLKRKKKELRLLVSLCMKSLMAQLIWGPQLDTLLSDHKKGTPSKNPKRTKKFVLLRTPKGSSDAKWDLIYGPQAGIPRGTPISEPI